MEKNGPTTNKSMPYIPPLHFHNAPTPTSSHDTLGNTARHLLSPFHLHCHTRLPNRHLLKSPFARRKQTEDNSFVKIGAVGANDSSYIDNDVICGYTYHYAVYAHQEGKNALLSRSNNSTAAPIHKSTVQPAQLVRATVQDDNHILVEFSQPVFQKTPIDYYTIEKSADGINYKDIFTTK